MQENAYEKTNKLKLDGNFKPYAYIKIYYLKNNI